MLNTLIEWLETRNCRINLLRTYEHVNLRICSRRNCCYFLFSALLVPVPLSYLKSKILVPRSGMSPPCQENRYPAGDPIRKISFRTKELLRTTTYSFARKRIQAFYGNEVCYTSNRCSNLLGLSAESN